MNDKPKYYPMTIGQLCACFKCDRKTMQKWIDQVADRVGPKIGYLYTPRQVRIIMEYVEGIGGETGG